MPAADKHDSGEANETAGIAGSEPAPAADPRGPADPAGGFAYDPLAPEPGSPAATAASVNPAQAAAPADESTIGTGTSIALGCVAGSVVLIVIAILILFVFSVIVK